jgi:hypothetical protein
VCHINSKPSAISLNKKAKGNRKKPLNGRGIFLIKENNISE